MKPLLSKGFPDISRLSREKAGAAEGTRTPDPIITNDVGWTPTHLITWRFLFAVCRVARMLQDCIRSLAFSLSDQLANSVAERA
jgi:hypothetical protein